MILYARDHGIVIGHDLAAQRVRVADIAPDCAFAIGVGIHLVERCVSLTYNSLPHQQLRGNRMAHVRRIRRILASPGSRDVALIPILHDAPQQYLDGIRRDGHIVAGGVVLPIVLIPACERIAGVLSDTGLNAVGDLAVIGSDGVDRRVIMGHVAPAAHKLCGRMSPGCPRIIAVAVTGEVHHIGVHRCGGKHSRGQGRQRGQAHEQCQKSRESSFQCLVFHKVTS